MPRLIVVCGLGGTGKTALADALARRLNTVCLHKDTIKATLYDRLGLLTDRSFAVFAALIEEQLANGVDLIVEATFHTDEAADVLRHWQTAYGVELTCIVCEASTPERRRRLETRSRHISHARADAAQIERLGREAVDYSALPGRRIAVATERPVAECLADVLAELGPATSTRAPTG